MTITTSGTPTPHLKKRGRLPKGLHFHNNHNGTATISGTPTAHNTPGAHALTEAFDTKDSWLGTQRALLLAVALAR